MAASAALLSALLVGGAASRPAWSDEDLAALRSMWIGSLGAPPADPTNRFANDPAAARLGEALFADTRLSSNGQVSCASCHQADHSFTDTVPTGKGVGTGSRRTMPVAVAVYSPWQFWDGRADSLWAQALGPVENPVEHNFTRTEVAHVVARHYRQSYEDVFGGLPDLTDETRFPQRASPAGDAQARAAWNGMSTADRTVVDQIYVNFGKSIAAFERTLEVRPSRFDRFLAGLFDRPGPHETLTADELAGLRLFLGKGECANCHNGPLLSNQGFANTGVPVRPGAAEDFGRAVGVRSALSDPFNCKGAYSDAPDHCDELEFAVADSPSQVRAYKVPSLRGVAQRAPYMHAGQFASIEAVLDHYSRAPRAPAGRSEIHPANFTVTERRQLGAFLHALDEQPSEPAQQ